jgi:hypothetical protein
MNGFEFNDIHVSRLKETIQYLDPPVLVIFDGLSKMIKGKLRENETADAIKVTQYWSELTKIGATLLILHHLTLKKESNYSDADFLRNVMGNTKLVSSCDTAIGMHRAANNPVQFVCKPIARRTSLSENPIVIIMREDRDQTYAKLTVSDEGIPRHPSEEAAQLFSLFYVPEATNQELTVKIISREINSRFPDNTIRAVLTELEQEICIIRVRERGKAHRFLYKLHPSITPPTETPDGKLIDNDYAVLTVYQEEIIERCK